MSLPTDFDLKERVRSAVDIVDVIGATLELQPQGRNLVARCPWHDDRRPSMTVNRERQTWKCWPCDIGGDVFSFVMRRDGVDFPTAVRTLAEVAGIAVEEYRRGKKTRPGEPDDKATLLAAMKLVADAYFQQLESGTSDDAKIARDYVAQRGISDESRQRFQIGLAPDSWSFAVDLLQKHNFSGEVAHAAGLASKRSSGQGFVDMFRGRLMFPIHDLQNRPIALGGRVIPPIAERHGDRAGGKYINGRETMLFRKSQQLYGLQLAREAIRRSGEVLVMEGYTDVVACRQAGIQPVVAVLGTALGEQHIKILKRFADRVVLVLDGDEAGRSRADEVLELFVRAEVDMRVLTLPDGNDPAEFVEAHGSRQLQQLASEAPDALDHRLARLTDGVDPVRDTHAVTAAVESILRVAASASDGVRIDQLLTRISRTFHLDVARLERQLEYLRGSRIQRDALNKLKTSDTTFAQQKLQPLSGIERMLFETLIEDPRIAAKAIESIKIDWLGSATAKMLMSAYRDLDLAQKNLDVDSILTFVENEPLKNEIVSLSSRVEERENQLPDSAEDRYAAIITYYNRQRKHELELIEEDELLSSAQMPIEDEVAALASRFANEQKRRKDAHDSYRNEKRVPKQRSDRPR